MGLFDVWDTFTDFVGDWWKAFKDRIWDIKNELWDWVDGIAKYWVERANEFWDILNHTWTEVEDLMEQAKSYADDIVTDAVLKIDNWITTFGETVAELWNKLEPYFSSMITPLENAVDAIQNIKIPSLEDITNSLKSTVDDILNWDIPFLNQSVKDLWTEADKIWNKIWEIPEDAWKAISGGWKGLVDFLTQKGEEFVDALLSIDLPFDDFISQIREDVEKEMEEEEERKG